MEITPNPDALYASYASLLYGYILQQITDTDIADRVFVETVKYAFSHSQEYQKENSRYYSWLLRIARKQIDDTNK